MKKAQYLFFDIDGTLIYEGAKCLLESAKEALRMAREKEHKIFINSGRTMCCLPPFLLEGFDGYLCGCGTNLYLDGREVLHVEIPAGIIREIAQSAVKYNVHVIFEGKDAIYFAKKSMEHPLAQFWYNAYKAQGTNTVIYLPEDEIICSKFCMAAEEQSDIPAFLDTIAKDFETIDRGGSFFEVLPKGYSKSTAMEAVLNFYGGVQEDTWAFGDSSNDLPMFQFAKHTVAMGQHDTVLEECAEFIADTVENDGLYKIMRQQGLI